MEKFSFKKNISSQNPLLNQNSGDLKQLKSVTLFGRFRVSVMLLVGLLLGTPLAVPTFAGYVELLTNSDSMSEEELLAKKEKHDQQLLWGVLVLTCAAGFLTFKSLKGAESLDSSEEFFSGDDLDEELEAELDEAFEEWVRQQELLDEVDDEFNEED